MNELEVFVTNVGSITGETDRIRYILSDELFDLINFADPYFDDQITEFKNNFPFAVLSSGEVDVSLLSFDEKIIWSTLSSIETFHIETDSSSYNEFELTLNAPVQIKFNPEKIITKGKIYKIEYTFNFETGENKTQTLFYKPTSDNTLSYPISSEPGDPRNYPQTFVYNLTSAFEYLIYAIIKVYEYGAFAPNEILYKINLRAPDLEGPDGIFNEVHLISNKMFGFDDNIIYTFESYNPKYILPVLVNWKQDQNVLVEAQKLKRLNLKPYRVLEPFEYDGISNKNVKTIEFSPSHSYSIDEGYSHQYNIITRDTSYYITTQDGKHIRIGDYYNSNLNKPQPPIEIEIILISEDEDPILSEDGDFMLV